MIKQIFFMLNIASSCLTIDSAIPMETVGNKRSVIYEHIIKNQPNLERGYARRLTGAIYKAAQKHTVSAVLLTAILMQESHYKLNRIGYKHRKAIDWGISQINVGTLKNFKMDKGRLLSDLDYSVEAGARVLASKKHYQGFITPYWSFYNGGNSHSRKKYTMAVFKYL